MALCLSRRAGESIELFDADGPLATVTISEIKGNQVKIAIEAQGFVKIWRSELLKGSLEPSADRER